MCAIITRGRSHCQMARVQHVGNARVIARTVGPADTTEQERLKLEAGEIVLRVTRVRVKGELPASYALAVLPLARFPGLTADSDAHEDIVALGRAHGVPLGRATEDADTAYPAADVAEYLGVDPDEEVLKLERIVRCARGLPVEWRVAYFCMDSDRFDG